MTILYLRRLISCSLVVLAWNACIVSAESQLDVTADSESSVQNESGEEYVEGIRLAPRAFRLAAERVRPALVTIESYGGATAIEGKIGGIRRQGEGNSTGLLISSDGYIVTSTFSFLRSTPLTTVVLSDGSRHAAKVVGRDDTRLICLLKIDAEVDLQLPEMVPKADVVVGQWAVAVGVGYGDTRSAISAGIVSAKNRIFGRAVQTDANISPANYGGPLIDIAGRVIGICVPLSPGTANAASGVQWYDSGIGFAIPLGGEEDLLAKLKNGEDIRLGYLGIQMRPTDDLSPGVIVEEVVEDSPASTAGLQAEDKIVRVDDDEVIDQSQIRVLIGRHAEGEEIILGIVRGQETLTLTVTLGGRPESE